MQQRNSIQEICSILQGIEKVYREAAALFHLYGYWERPDIIKPGTKLIRTYVSVGFDAEAIIEALRIAGKEMQEKDCIQAAVKAAELLYRLDELEETLKLNKH